MAKKKTFWWMRVNDPDRVIRQAAAPVSNRRTRYSTVLQQTGIFRNEPALAQALVQADVPLALAMRSYEQIAARKAQGVARQMNLAGYSEASLEPNVARTPQNAAAADPRNQDPGVAGAQPPAPIAENDGGGGFLGALGDAASAVGGFLTGAGEAAMEGLTWGYNRVVGAPLAAGYATDTGFDTWRQNVSEDVAGEWGGGLVQAPLALAGGVSNFFEGVYRNITGDISAEQQTDMRRAGLNPENAGDRVSYYSNDFGEVQSAVSDADVRWLKNDGRWSPQEVDAAREIVTRGALEDLTRAFPSLSPTAQNLVMRATEDDSRAELIKAMGDTSQLSFGGRMVRATLPDAAPGDTGGPGSLNRAIVAGIADVAAMWHLDPAVLAAKGVQAGRAARFGVNTQTADRLDATAQMLKASDDAFKPKGMVARRFDQAMGTADQIVTLMAKGDEGLVQAGKLREGWLRRFPGYESTLDTLIGMRTGAIGHVQVRSGTAARSEVKAAADRGRVAKSWTVEATGDGKPLWRFTDDDGNLLPADVRATERAKVADELAAFIFMEAASSGRPYVGSKMILPGQLSVNGAIRNKLAPVAEAITRRDKSVMKQIREAGGSPININQGVTADAKARFETLISPEGSEWVRNNYTFGISHAFARGWRHLEKSFSRKTIVPSSPDSVKEFQQLVSAFMPKRQAQVASTIYAASNPGERYMMVRQTLGSLINVMNLRNDPVSQRIVENMTKGLVPTDDLLAKGYKVGARQWYTTPDNNFVRVGDLKMPGAVYPWQLADGIDLPDFRELRGLVDRGALLGTIGRVTNSDTANAMITAWKSLKVSSWANMFRQAIEVGVFTAATAPKALGGYRQARKSVKADIKLRRVNDRDLERLANKINELDANDLDTLETVRRRDPDTFIQTLNSMFAKNGIDPSMTEVLSRMASHGDVTEWAAEIKAPTGIRPQYLAFMGLWDARKRVAAQRMEAKAGKLTDSPISRYLDEEMLADLTQAHARQLGTAAETYGWTSADKGYVAIRKNITDAAGRAVSFRPTKINNGYKWLKDGNADVWAAELSRRMKDPAAATVMRYIATRHLHGVEEARKTLTPPRAASDPALDLEAATKFTTARSKELFEQRTKDARELIARADEIDKLTKLQAKGRPNSRAYQKRADRLDELGVVTAQEVADAKQLISDTATALKNDPLLDPSRLRNPDEFAAYVLREHELGRPMREQAVRLQFLPDGTPVSNSQDLGVAAEQAAFAMVNDLVHHLGGKPVRSSALGTQLPHLDPQFGAGVTDPAVHDAFDKVMEKIRDGFTPSGDDLKPLLDKGYGPDGMVAPLHSPMMPGKGSLSDRLANFSTRAYGAIVAGPLERLTLLPLFIANKRIALGEMEDLIGELTKRGLSNGQAAFLLENTASQRALNLVFRGTDNPMDKTIFAEMADKWLPFTRANLDFLRRFAQATIFKPEAIARAHVLMQAATGAGILHYEPLPDEEGNTEYRLTFAYPGTALAQRVLSDAAAAFGMAPEEILRVPQFDGLKSQVRFLNPGVANPFGFSANPVFGLSLSLASAVWPESMIEFERIKKGLSGGQDFEGKVGISDPGTYALHQFVPSMFSRFIPLMKKDDAEGQFQSAFRAALMYAEVAGLTPPANASQAEHARFQDAVKATTTNILIQRAIFGTFLPASPQLADPEDITPNILARMQGLPNLRSEFFDIRKELSAKYPDDFQRADNEAVVEFARRYPGELIVNPGAFGVGSTDMEGSDQYVPYSLEATRWMLENKDFVKSNPLMAIAMLPESAAQGKFSNEAYKLQFKADLRTNKDLEEFYLDITTDGEISEFFRVTKEFSVQAKQLPAFEKQIYARMNTWQDQWKRAHPAAAAELERRQDPQFVHAETIPAIEAVVSGRDPVPENMRHLIPGMQEMLKDYQEYRTGYERVSYYNNAGRSQANKKYRTQGDMKWMGTPLERVWDLVRVTEGY